VLFLTGMVHGSGISP